MSDHPHVLAQNVLEDCDVTYDATEDPIYKAQYLANRSRISKFVGEDTATQHVVFDYGAAVSVDTFALDRNYTISGASSQLILQYSDTGAWAGEETSLITMTKAGDLADNTIPVWKTFTAESHRYWRLRFVNLTAAPVIFNVWLGTRIQLTMSPYGPFDPWEEISDDKFTENPSGATQILHKFSKRLHHSEWQNMVDSQVTLHETWWTQARRDGKPWWFLWKPASYSGDTTTWQPVLFVSPSGGRKMPFNPATRSTTIEGTEA